MAGRRESEAGRALDKRLGAMFRALQARPTPERLRATVEQLDLAPAAGDAKRAG